MGCRYRLEVGAPGYQTQVQEGELSDEDSGLLQLYLDQYALITASQTLASGLPCNLKIKWDGDQASVETDLPDADTVGLLLHRLRPFILQSEPASFLTVAALVGREVDLPSIRDLLGRLRREFDGRTFRQTIAIDINDIALNSDRVLTDWLNSHEYHRDPDKREVVDGLLEAFPGELARAVFVGMIIDKLRACGGLAQIVAVLLNRGAKLAFTGDSDTFIALPGSDEQAPQPDAPELAHNDRE